MHLYLISNLLCVLFTVMHKNLMDFFSENRKGVVFVLFSMPHNQHGGAVCLKSKLYLGVKISTDIVTETLLSSMHSIYDHSPCFAALTAGYVLTCTWNRPKAPCVDS